MNFTRKRRSRTTQVVSGVEMAVSCSVETDSTSTAEAAADLAALVQPLISAEPRHPRSVGLFACGFTKQPCFVKPLRLHPQRHHRSSVAFDFPLLRPDGGACYPNPRLRAAAPDKTGQNVEDSNTSPK